MFFVAFIKNVVNLHVVNIRISFKVVCIWNFSVSE